MRLGELVCGELSDLLEKVGSGERLGRRDFLRLWKTQDLTGLGAVANFAASASPAAGPFSDIRHTWTAPVARAFSAPIATVGDNPPNPRLQFIPSAQPHPGARAPRVKFMSPVD